MHSSSKYVESTYSVGGAWHHAWHQSGYHAVTQYGDHRFDDRRWGLGFDVLLALRRLDIGGGLQSGLAIVALAVALDRLSQAAARYVQRSRRHRRSIRGGGTVWILVGGVLALGYGTSYIWPGSHVYPATWTIDTSAYWNELAQWINLNWFDALNGAKTSILIFILIPLKRFLLELPWLLVVGLLGLAAYAVSGPKLTILTAALSIFIVGAGLW